MEVVRNMNIKIPTAKEDSIPELNKLKRNFAKLISSDNEYQNKSTKDILDCIKTAYGGITRPIHFNEWQTCKDTTGYRIISEADFQANDLILENPSSFSFPENPKLGRANLPGFPVLYASDNAHTAIYEKIASNPESFIGEKFICRNGG